MAAELPELVWARVDEIIVDERYQRAMTNAGQRRVRRIADGFQWALFGALILARRCDPNHSAKFAAIDGQHRLAAARALGLARVPAVVVPPCDAAAEAAVFVQVNRARAAVSALDRHRADVAAGAELACAVQRVCDAAGVGVARQGGGRALPPGQLACVRTLARILPELGEDAVAAGLRAIAQALPAERGAFMDMLVAGAARTSFAKLRMRENGEGLDEALLAQAVARLDRPRLYAEAAASARPGWAVIADELRRLYDASTGSARAETELAGGPPASMSPPAPRASPAARGHLPSALPARVRPSDGEHVKPQAPASQARERNCMTCGKPFWSESFGHRLCNAHRHDSAVDA